MRDPGFPLDVDYVLLMCGGCGEAITARHGTIKFDLEHRVFYCSIQCEFDAKDRRRAEA